MQYCSQACRRRGLTDVDRRAEAAIRDELALGPREIALEDVSLGTEVVDKEVLRRAARRLVAAGDVDLVQRGRIVDPSTAKGPVSVRARRTR